jgi:geranylgeranylglycerol-phosphate geranylgeranyltransferase
LHPSAYLKILRPFNAAMSAGAVCLGAWISASRLSPLNIAILAAVAASATGFGNIINDIFDMETDRISHPDRPLVRGTISRTNALIYAIVLAVFALGAAFIISPLSGIAALLPLLILAIYAIAFKGTPLAGNVIVSLLVAYALLYGGLSAPCISHLVIPALLAMLLNFSREIIKDIQDVKGDQAAGITTSATLPSPFLKKLLFICSGMYLPLLFLPRLLGHFGAVYAVIVSITALPLHICRLFLLNRPDWEYRVSVISLLLKIEMAFGLVALAIDHLF